MDHAILATMDAWRSPPLTAMLAALTWLGSLAVLLPLACLLAWRQSGRDRHAAFLPLAVGGAALLAHILKIAFERPRPDLFPPLTDMPADASFPSAHAMQSTAFVVAWLLWSGRARRPAWWLAAATVILLVGLSRLYLQVHYPSDVAFGIMFGVAWAVGFHALSSRGRIG